MDEARFNKVRGVKRALDVLHARLDVVLREFAAECGMDEDQIVALGGGTPKTPPEED